MLITTMLMPFVLLFPLVVKASGRGGGRRRPPPITTSSISRPIQQQASPSPSPSPPAQPSSVTGGYTTAFPALHHPSYMPTHSYVDPRAASQPPNRYPPNQPPTQGYGTPQNRYPSTSGAAFMQPRPPPSTQPQHRAGYGAPIQTQHPYHQQQVPARYYSEPGTPPAIPGAPPNYGRRHQATAALALAPRPPQQGTPQFSGGSVPSGHPHGLNTGPPGSPQYALDMPGPSRSSTTSRRTSETEPPPYSAGSGGYVENRTPSGRYDGTLVRAGGPPPRHEGATHDNLTNNPYLPQSPNFTPQITQEMLQQMEAVQASRRGGIRARRQTQNQSPAVPRGDPATQWRRQEEQQANRAGRYFPSSDSDPDHFEEDPTA